MIPSERKETIVKLLNKKKFISTDELRKALFVSPATIRRDLVDLEKDKMVIRTLGGARLAPKSSLEHTQMMRENENLKEKEDIANMSATFIEDGFSLFLDSSTTVNSLIPYLKEFTNLKVITNGLKTALDLSYIDSIETIVVGGVLFNNSASTVGAISYETITNYNVDLCLLSCRGLDENGAYEASESQALVKQKMMLNSNKTLLLVDSSKFGNQFFYNLASLSQFDYIITDKKPQNYLLQKIENQGPMILEG